jgi:hypothetical protein
LIWGFVEGETSLTYARTHVNTICWSLEVRESAFFVI